MGETKKDILFGKAVFGGFNRKDVMEYIDKLQKRLMECGDPDGESQENRLAQAEAELEDAKARIQSLMTALERANAEKATLLERLERTGSAADPEPESFEEDEIPEEPLVPDKATEVRNSLEEVSALLDQVTQLKAQLRVEKTANELLSEKFYAHNLEEPEAEATPEPEAAAESEQVAEPEVVAEPEPVVEPEAVTEPEPVAEQESAAEPEPESEPEPAGEFEQHSLSLDDVDIMIQNFFS